MNPDKKVAALGFFDGVHIAHRRILHMAAEKAKELGCLSCAVTFDVKPSEIISGKPSNLIIPDTEQRKNTILKYGNVDEVIVLHFDNHLMNIPYYDFIENILVKQYGIIRIVFGENYTCGKNCGGNADTIRNLCEKLSIGCDIVKNITVDKVTISSTVIRRLISEGNIFQAEKLLGHKL